MTKERLIDVLQQVGKPVELVRSEDGSEVMVLPYGGRVLGLFSPGRDENFYWTHPVLEHVETAKSFYEADQWHNSGGDRTWLAPEIDVFFPDYPSRDKYYQPRQLDPGRYVVEKKGPRIRLVNTLALTLSRSRDNINLEMAKTFGAALNPLRNDPGYRGSALDYAGYTQYTTLTIFGEHGDRVGPVGLWNLVQMPHGGEMRIMTYSRTEPRLIMGKISSDDLMVSDHEIRYHMRAAGEHKISVQSATTTGRVGYLYESAGRWSLIVRNFFVNSSGEYVDSPWDAPEQMGFAVQACNVKSGLGSFSELEYHIPAIGRGTGQTQCKDTSVVWAYRGDRADILAVAKKLLGTE